MDELIIENMCSEKFKSISEILQYHLTIDTYPRLGWMGL